MGEYKEIQLGKPPFFYVQEKTQKKFFKIPKGTPGVSKANFLKPRRLYHSSRRGGLGAMQRGPEKGVSAVFSPGESFGFGLFCFEDSGVCE